MQLTAARAPILTRIANMAWAFSQRYWRVVLVSMLALLHIAVFRGVADPWARALLLAHLGLLLLWQPFLRGEQRVSPVQGAILALVASAVMLRLDWWFLAFWVVVLAGLVGGKVYQQHARWQRRCYLVVLAYLLALLAIAILPEIAPRREIQADVRAYAEYGLPLAFVLIALFPSEPDSADAPHIIDFFYSVFVMLVIVVVILGSFTFMSVTRTPYLEALTATIFVTAGGMLLVALAWNPRSGWSASTCFFPATCSRSACRWRSGCTCSPSCCKWRHGPERSWSEAVAALLRVPSVAGVRWRAGERADEQGTRTPHGVDYASSELALTIFSRYRLGPTLRWHLHLLGQLLGEFYVAKLREEKLRQASYLQAVHETGARMTHDIKNLLQSLSVLTSVAARDSGGDEARTSPELQALLRRQLPLIERRLSETLEKLQRPQEGGEHYAAARRLVGIARAPVPRRRGGIRAGHAAARPAAAALAVRQRRRQPDPQRAGEARRRCGCARARRF